MYPNFELFGRNIPTFGVAFLLAVASAVAVAVWLCPKRGISRLDIVPLGAFAMAGAFTGALLLRPLMRLPEMVSHWENYSQMAMGDLLGVLFGETVFYGGLIGGVLAGIAFCHMFKMPFIPILDIAAPAIAIGHAIGRIGCLFAGCCYGANVRANHPFAIVYPQRSLGAPPGVPLLAVPIIEAVCLAVIAIFLILLLHKTKKVGLCAAVYLMSYAVLRFTLEFYRGDSIRGIYAGLSTSQYISIAVFAVGLWCMARVYKTDGFSFAKTNFSNKG